MSEKNVHISLEGRGDFRDVNKDTDADLVIAYIMNFGEDATETDVAVVGRHTIGNKAFAAQLGRVTASMLVSTFDNVTGAPEYWTKFQNAFEDEMAIHTKKKLKEILGRLKVMFEDEEDEENKEEE